MRFILAAIILCFSLSAHAETFKDIAYGTDKKQTLDIYAPYGPAMPLPVLILVHGGGWQRGDKSMAERHAEFYTQNNIVLVSINYRLSPDFKHPAQVQDIAQAVRWVHMNILGYGGHPDQIHLAGHSAGAHLVALIGTDESYFEAYHLSPTLIKTIIPIDTASFDFLTPLEKGRWLVQPKIDETFGTEKDALKAASPLYHVAAGKDIPPFLLFVTQERPDAAEQTKTFHSALLNAGVKSQIFTIPELSHRQMQLNISNPDSQIAQNILKAIKAK